MAFCLMEGNEAIRWGAIASGCRFFAGYPITPATTIFNTLLELLPPLGGICLQGEDEIASIGYCLGASMAGLRVFSDRHLENMSGTVYQTQQNDASTHRRFSCQAPIHKNSHT